MYKAIGSLKLFFNYKTPSAALQSLTEYKGMYSWYGITIGEVFIGVMRSGYNGVE